ncbi:hypothetical protein C8Q78DRAFT_471170 [Trametes maxima]|nr:hypothetical protein C8Q78DRAFT_471170 [Trametes maxima]
MARANTDRNNLNMFGRPRCVSLLPRVGASGVLTRIICRIAFPTPIHTRLGHTPRPAPPENVDSSLYSHISRARAHHCITLKLVRRPKTPTNLKDVDLDSNIPDRPTTCSTWANDHHFPTFVTSGAGSARPPPPHGPAPRPPIGRWHSEMVAHAAQNSRWRGRLRCVHYAGASAGGGMNLPAHVAYPSPPTALRLFLLEVTSPAAGCDTTRLGRHRRRIRGCGGCSGCSCPALSVPLAIPTYTLPATEGVSRC